MLHLKVWCFTSLCSFVRGSQPPRMFRLSPTKRAQTSRPTRNPVRVVRAGVWGQTWANPKTLNPPNLRMLGPKLCPRLGDSKQSTKRASCRSPSSSSSLPPGSKAVKEEDGISTACFFFTGTCHDLSVVIFSWDFLLTPCVMTCVFVLPFA